MGGAGHREKELLLTKCSSQETDGSSPISYGDENKEAICWKLKDESESASLLNGINDSLTTLFKKMWKTGSENWNSNSEGQWKSQCVKSSKGWTIEQESTHEYLGKCEEDVENIENVTFLDIYKKEKKVEKIQLCFRNCFSLTQPAQNIQQLKNTAESWKEVQFFIN